MLRECSLSSVQYLDSSSIATAERAVRAKHRMPSPFLVPISTASVFRRSSATVLCTACGERIGGQSTGLTSDAQSIGSGRAACIGLAWSASLRPAAHPARAGDKGCEEPTRCAAKPLKANPPTTPDTPNCRDRCEKDTRSLQLEVELPTDTHAPPAATRRVLRSYRTRRQDATATAAEPREAALAR